MKLSSIEKISVIIIIAIIFMIFNPFGAAVYSGPAMLDVPDQVTLSSPQSITMDIKDESINLELLATYEVKAGVRSRKNYYFDDSSAVSPMDLVLAWGSLNEKEAVEGVNYRQSGRWYYYQTKEEAPVTLSYINAHSANTHIIPATKEVHRQLKKMRENNYVVMSGYLVNVSFPSGGVWKTSTTRTDAGNGSCEIFYVESVEIR